MLEEEEELRTPPPPRHSQQVPQGVELQVGSTSCLEVRTTMTMTATLSSRLSMPGAALTQEIW